MKYISKGESETENFAEGLAKKLGNDRTYLLIGDLGAGKTAFTRGLARGYQARRLRSFTNMTGT